MSLSRQLAAIMFTDIVGYTALMGDDEQKAFEILKYNRHLHKTQIEQYGGKQIKELGDGILVSFSNATDAVNCACLLIKGCEQTEGLQLRIGIHLGDVIFENDDVFGDGVNIASRLQAIASIGGIWISESVYRNVSNKKEINTRYIGEEVLKNVKEPVKVYEVITGNSNGKPQSHTDLEKRLVQKVSEKSVAVLPFVNMSNDPEQEYFSDGITEEILNSLSHLNDLKVAGRTSSFRYKGAKVDLREIGHDLGVGTVLEGSVRKQGSRLRITAQLINVEDGFHLWSEKYDRSMDDIFAIQDEIALTITDKLKVTLLEHEKEVIYKIPTENKEAYDLYLKGRFYLNKRGQGLKEGLKYFLQAVDIDPQFALAHAGIADAHALLALYCVLPPHDAMPKAKKAAEMAVQLDASLVEPLNTLAFVSTFYEWNWIEADKRFQRVFEINPNYAPGHYWNSLYLSWVKRQFQQARKEAETAQKLLEPLASVSHHLIAVMLISLGEFEEALKESNMAIELDAKSFPGYRALGVCLAALNRFDESIEALKTSANISSRHQTVLGELCWVYSLAGKVSEAKKILEELLIRSETEFISGLFLCCAAYYSENYDKAITFLQLAFEQRDGTLISIRVWPPFTFLHMDLRFRPVIEKMNFP